MMQFSFNGASISGPIQQGRHSLTMTDLATHDVMETAQST